MAYENYYITVSLEMRCLLTMLHTLLLPVARSGTAQAVGLGRELEASAKALEAERAEIDRAAEEDMLDCAGLCNEVRLGLMVKIRKLVDQLEELVPAKEWPIATYDECLFDDMAHCRMAGAAL